MTQAELRERAPQGEPLTDYDREHATVYLRLLDAEAAGADWREVAAIVLKVDPAHDPDRARIMHETHLARAQWLRDGGYKDLLTSTQS
jgi:hypothetical protein